MTDGPIWRRLLLGLGLLAALGGALGACGKRGSPEVPEGQEDVYFYPRFYPSPRKEPPLFGGAPAAAAPVAETEEDRVKKRKRRERKQRRFRDRPTSDPLSSDDNTIGTYETAPK